MNFHPLVMLSCETILTRFCLWRRAVQHPSCKSYARSYEDLLTHDGVFILQNKGLFNVSSTPSVVDPEFRQIQTKLAIQQNLHNRSENDIR